MTGLRAYVSIRYHLPRFYKPVESAEEAWTVIHAFKELTEFYMDKGIIKDKDEVFVGLEEWDEDEQCWQEWYDDNNLTITDYE